MNKKTVLLLGLTATTTMAAVGVALLGDKEVNQRAFAQDAEPGRYVAVIDANNRLRPTGDTDRYGFRLHNGEEYGYFYSSDGERLDINPTGAYSDYAFAWDNPDGTSKYCEIFFRDFGNTRTYEIDGKVRALRGFPGIKKVTTVYLNPSNIRVDDTRPTTAWGFTTETDEKTGLITEIATAPENLGTIDYTTWTTRSVGTIYIKSITIEYTCA